MGLIKDMIKDVKTNKYTNEFFKITIEYRDMLNLSVDAIKNMRRANADDGKIYYAEARLDLLRRLYENGKMFIYRNVEHLDDEKLKAVIKQEVTQHHPTKVDLELAQKRLKEAKYVYEDIMATAYAGIKAHTSYTK